MFAPSFGVHFRGDSLNVDWILSLEPLSVMIRIDGDPSTSAAVPEDDHLQLFELMRRPFPKDRELVERHIIEEERHLSQAKPEDDPDSGSGPGQTASYGGCGCRTDEGELPCYDEAPIPITAPAPRYPEFAREAQIQGKVILCVLVGANGHVENIKVFRGITGLNDVSVDAVRRWVFKPALKDGDPISVWTEVPVDFHF